MRISRTTKQKNAIIQIIKTQSSFFNAHEIHSKAKTKDQAIGIATVYRFLKDQVNSGTLHTYQCNRKTIYSTSSRNHAHFICERCGNTSHIKTDDLTSITKKITETICHIQIDITGICKECTKKSKHE